MKVLVVVLIVVIAMLANYVVRSDRERDQVISNKVTYFEKLTPVIDSHAVSLTEWNSFITGFAELNYEAMALDELSDSLLIFEEQATTLGKVSEENTEIMMQLEVPLDCRDAHLIIFDAFRATGEAASLYAIWAIKFDAQLESAQLTGDFSIDSLLNTSGLEEGDRVLSEANRLKQESRFELEDCTK